MGWLGELKGFDEDYGAYTFFSEGFEGLFSGNWMQFLDPGDIFGSQAAADALKDAGNVQAAIAMQDLGISQSEAQRRKDVFLPVEQQMTKEAGMSGAERYQKDIAPAYERGEKTAGTIANQELSRYGGDLGGIASDRISNIMDPAKDAEKRRTKLEELTRNEQLLGTFRNVVPETLNVLGQAGNTAGGAVAMANARLNQAQSGMSNLARGIGGFASLRNPTNTTTNTLPATASSSPSGYTGSDWGSGAGLLGSGDAFGLGGGGGGGIISDGGGGGGFGGFGDDDFGIPF